MEEGRPQKMVRNRKQVREEIGTAKIYAGQYEYALLLVSVILLLSLCSLFSILDVQILNIKNYRNAK